MTAKGKEVKEPQGGEDLKSTKPKSEKYTVVSPFADKSNFNKMWNEGDDVSHFDEPRLADCVKRGLVKKG